MTLNKDFFFAETLKVINVDICNSLSHADWMPPVLKRWIVSNDIEPLSLALPLELPIFLKTLVVDNRGLQPLDFALRNTTTPQYRNTEMNDTRWQNAGSP